MNTKAHTHIGNRAVHYHIGSESLLQQSAPNSKPLMLSETNNDVEEISSYLPRANTIKFMPLRHNPLELVKPTELQVMPVMKAKKKSVHVYLHFCSHHEGQCQGMCFSLPSRPL